MLKYHKEKHWMENDLRRTKCQDVWRFGTLAVVSKFRFMFNFV